MANWQIENENVMTWCKEYKGEPFSAMICDPPYHLIQSSRGGSMRNPGSGPYGRHTNSTKGFMGSIWDGGGIAFDPATWAALSEHLLPGAFGMAFASSRGWHRLACAIEDAGLRIHPSIFCWAQGQGFCKATNIHLQLEKRLCYQDESKDWFYKDDNEPIRTKPPFRHPTADRFYGHRYGGQALAPKVEPIIVFQKPYEGRPVDCIVETGAGALNIEKARVKANSHAYEHGVLASVAPSAPLLQDAAGILWCTDESSHGLPQHTCASSQHIQELNDILFGEQESPLDVLYRIASALRYCSTDSKDPARDVDDLDDKMPARALCELLQARLYPSGVWCGLDLLSGLDSLSGYQSCPHLYDELLHHIQEAAQDGIPSLADALKHIHLVLSKSLHSHSADSDHLSNSDVLALSLSLCQLLTSDLYMPIIPQSKPLRKATPGRWPPNFALCHVSPSLCATCDGDGCDECNDTGLVGGCRRVGTKRVKGSNAAGQWSTAQGFGWGFGPRKPFDYNDINGTEEVAAWECCESCAARRIGEQSGKSKSPKPYERGTQGISTGYSGDLPWPDARANYGDAGNCTRFFPQFGWAAEIAERLAAADQVFYASKASRTERDAGLEHLVEIAGHSAYGDYAGTPEHATNKRGRLRNFHPTVKNIELCHWLATLLLPPPEYAPRRILIPFAGVMSEAIAAMLAGWEEIVAIEMSKEYCEIGEARLRFWSQFDSYKAAMDAARNIQQAHRKRDTQIKNGQLKLAL